VGRGAEEERLNNQVVRLRVLPIPAMRGMLRESTVFVPRYQKFESISLQRRVACEPDFLDRGAENIAERDSVTHYAQL
jgi:hypothetical protein